MRGEIGLGGCDEGLFQMGVLKQARFFSDPLFEKVLSFWEKWLHPIRREGKRDFIQKETFLEKFRKRVQQLKKKRPGYSEILNFYQKVKEAQDQIKASLKIEPLKLNKAWKDLLAKEGFPLIQKEDFPMDIEASVNLFQILCQIGENANPHLAEQVKKIKEATEQKKIDLRKCLEQGAKEKKVRQFAKELKLDNKVFLFLIQNSLKPSIEVGVEQFRNEIDSENWLKGSCPICGSLPALSLLRGEGGKRYLICSYCSYQWRIDRLLCPFCHNQKQASLQYFYGEGEEYYRIDLCDKCHRYIKTIDYRNLEESDPFLEDIATLHLDRLAIQKGYKKPIPHPWMT